MSLESKDVVALSMAAVGAVLGIINTWHSLDQRRVRLRVVPKLAHPIINGEFGPTMGCIEVVNLSTFPISVEEIGFTLKGQSKRLTVSKPETLDRQPFARTLEPRHAVTGYFDLNCMVPEIE